MDETRNLARLFLAGFVATFATTMMFFPAFQYGLTKLDFANLIGAFLSGKEVVIGSVLWWVGFIEHFVNGTILFPLLYAYFVERILPGSNLIKGLLWGLILWFFAQAVVLPVLGLGFFSSNAVAQEILLLGSLLGHLIYGLLFGAIVSKVETMEGQASRPSRNAA